MCLSFLTYTISNTYIFLTLLYNILTDGLKIKFIKLRDKSYPSEFLPWATVKIDVFQ